MPQTEHEIRYPVHSRCAARSASPEIQRLLRDSATPRSQKGPAGKIFPPLRLDFTVSAGPASPPYSLRASFHTAWVGKRQRSAGRGRDPRPALGIAVSGSWPTTGGLGGGPDIKPGPPCSLPSPRSDRLRGAAEIFEFRALRGMLGCVLVRKLFQVEEFPADGWKGLCLRQADRFEIRFAVMQAE
jgi:hypothetical protein